MNRHITLRQFRYFIAVAESSSVAAASRMLNIARSAITKSILELEDALGVRLFERSRKGMVLTPDGHRFLASARKVLSAVARRDPAAPRLALAAVRAAGHRRDQPGGRDAHAQPQPCVDGGQPSAVRAQGGLARRLRAPRPRRPRGRTLAGGRGRRHHGAARLPRPPLDAGRRACGAAPAARRAAHGGRQPGVAPRPRTQGGRGGIHRGRARAVPHAGPPARAPDPWVSRPGPRGRAPAARTHGPPRPASAPALRGRPAPAPGASASAVRARRCAPATRPRGRSG